MKHLSLAAHNLEGQRMFQILAKAREMERNGREILHFELGDPDFSTPPNIAAKGIMAMMERTHYAPSAGIYELKEAAAEVTLRSRGFKPSHDQLLVTAGANVQIFYALACCVNPGEEVIVPDPGFVSYYSILKFLSIKAVRVPLREENEFRLNPDDVRAAITDNTRMIIINSPSNPTGAVMTAREVEDIYWLAANNDIYLLSDEVYARIVFEGNHCSPSGFDHCQKRVIVVNGFSKSYAMTGWRLGVATGPAEVISKMGLLLETTSSCVSPFIQLAGVEALRGDQGQILVMVEEYRKRRDIMVEGLNKLPGVSCLMPKGAFYVFPNITKTGMTSEQFADRMLERAGVAVTPGTVFGEHGEGYVRLCCVNDKLIIMRAIVAMREVLR